jgi:hypothetical protein
VAHGVGGQDIDDLVSSGENIWGHPLKGTCQEKKLLRGRTNGVKSLFLTLPRQFGKKLLDGEAAANPI